MWGPLYFVVTDQILHFLLFNEDVKRKFIQFLDAFSNGLFIVKYIWLQYMYRIINGFLCNSWK